MFNIILYQNSAENNRVNKSDYLKKVFELSGTLREGTSILEPDIIIEATIQDGAYIVTGSGVKVTANGKLLPIIGTGYSLFDCNYAYIKEFNRYYYINDISSISNNLWELSMSVDVLMSYRDQIMNINAFISRNEFSYDPYLPDGKLPMLQGNDIEVVHVEELRNPEINRFFKKLRAYTNIKPDERCVIVQVSASNATQVGINKLKIPYNIGTIATNTTVFNTTYVMNTNAFLWFCDYVAKANLWNGGFLFSNPSNSLVSFKIYPIPYGLTNTPQEVVNEIHIGTGKIDLTNYMDETGDLTPITRILRPEPLSLDLGTIRYDFSNEEFKFLMYQPYANMQLFLPYYGFIDIDVNLFITRSEFTGLSYGYADICIKVTYDIDIITGLCRAILWHHGTARYQFEFDISLDAPTGYSNASDVTRNMVISTIKLVAAVATKGASLAADAGDVKDLESYSAGSKSKKLPLAVASKKRHLRSDIIGDVADTAGSFTANVVSGSQSKVTGGVANNGFCKGLMIDYADSGYITPFLVIKKPIPALSVPSHYRGYERILGRPLQRYERLEYVHGYTEVSGCHLDYVLATETEKDDIKRSLISGVILP